MPSDDRARIDYLIDRLDKAKSRIIVPMPAVAEFIAGADVAGIEAINALESKSSVVLASFDLPAAFECAQLDRAAKGAGNKKDGSGSPWQKLKVDRQIVAIGKAMGAGLVVSNDSDVRANALRAGMKACSVQELELPDSARQVPMEFEQRPSRAPGKRHQAVRKAKSEVVNDSDRESKAEG